MAKRGVVSSFANKNITSSMVFATEDAYMRVKSDFICYDGKSNGCTEVAFAISLCKWNLLFIFWREVTLNSSKRPGRHI